MTSILEVEQLDTLSSNAANTITIGGTNTTTIAFGPNVTTTPSSLANTPSFFAYNSSNQSITNGVWTKMTFDTEMYDTDSAFASNTFTVPSGKGGKYFVFQNIRYGGLNSGAINYCGIYKNGSLASAQFFRCTNTGDAISFGYSGVFNLSESDYIESWTYNGDTTSRNIEGSGSNIRVLFGAYKIIGA